MTALRAIAGTLRSRHWLAVVVFLLLPVIHTWPMASNPGVLSRTTTATRS